MSVIKKTKICLTCERPFEWRRKWKNCWDEVRHCSERCRRNKRKKPVEKPRMV
ncbi:MAG: DUF2256 domain-containing protein [Methylophilaceae bacterium]